MYVIFDSKKIQEYFIVRETYEKFSTEKFSNNLCLEKNSRRS